MKTTNNDNTFNNNINVPSHKINPALCGLIGTLYTDTLQGIHYWRQHKHHRCNACKQYGHIAKDCANVCKTCLNKHTNSVCVLALEDYYRRILYRLYKLSKIPDAKEFKLIQEECKKKAELDLVHKREFNAIARYNSMQITHEISCNIVPGLSIQNPCKVFLRSTTSTIKQLSNQLDKELLQLEKQYEDITTKYNQYQHDNSQITINDLQSLLQPEEDINTHIDKEDANPYEQQLEELGDKIVKIKQKIESNNYKLESFGSEAPEFSTYHNYYPINDKNYSQQLQNKKMKFETQKIKTAINLKQEKLSHLVEQESNIRSMINTKEHEKQKMANKQRDELMKRYKTAFNTVEITDGYDPHQLDIVIKPLIGKSKLLHVDKDVEVKSRITEINSQIYRLNSELSEIQSDTLNLNKQPLADFYPNNKGLVVIREDDTQNLPTEKTWLYTQLKSQLNHALKIFKKKQSRLQTYRNQQSVINEAQQIKKTQGDLKTQQQKLEDVKTKKQNEIAKVKDIKRNRHEIMNNMRDKAKRNLDKYKRKLQDKQDQIDYKYEKLEQAYQRFNNKKDNFYDKKKKFYDKKDDLYNKMRKANDQFKDVKRHLQDIKDSNYIKRSRIKKEALKYMSGTFANEFNKKYDEIVHDTGI
jgi:chromosome segregation ATPase